MKKVAKQNEYGADELPELIEQFVSNAINAHEYREDVVISFHHGYPVAVKSMTMKHRLDDWKKKCHARFDLKPLI